MVQVSEVMNTWVLCRGRVPGLIHSQFDLRPPTLGRGFECVGGSKEFGQISFASLDAAIDIFAGNLGVNERKGFYPDWARQCNRLMCPCVNNRDFYWSRYCKTTGLAGIFVALGKKYDSALLYYFYRTRMVVCLKRHKK